jgi:hypothetical protein
LWGLLPHSRWQPIRRIPSLRHRNPISWIRTPFRDFIQPSIPHMSLFCSRRGIRGRAQAGCRVPLGSIPIDHAGPNRYILPHSVFQ